MNTWQELTYITVSRGGGRSISNILIDLGSQGVAIDDSAGLSGEVLLGRCYSGITEYGWPRPLSRNRES